MITKVLGRNAYYIVFCLALLPLLFLRDFTPANELKYLSIADEALRNHTFFLSLITVNRTPTNLRFIYGLSCWENGFSEATKCCFYLWRPSFRPLQ